MYVVGLIERNAARWPHREALSCEDGTRWTWAEWQARVEVVAERLEALGVQRGDRVSSLSRNCLELFAVWLGANRLGAVYAPLNYRFTARELAEVVADSRPRVLATHADYDQMARGLEVDEVVDLAGLVATPRTAAAATVTGRAPAQNLGGGSLGDEVSLITYTGGTTGRPKGVMVTQRNLAGAAANFRAIAAPNEQDVYLLAGAMFYIALAVPPVYFEAGARTVVVNFDAAATLDVMVAEGVTRLIGTGTIFKLLVEEQETRPRTGLAVRIFEFGGAPMSARLARRARDAYGCGVAQIYGQSETTLLATYLSPDDYERLFALEDGDGQPLDRLGSVGRVVPGLDVAVVDGEGKPVPVGVVGEVLLRGDAIMVGYWQQPELTAETGRDGWHHTGDLGRVDKDGWLWLVDRAKDVIITGGENVYSAEVELVLADHPEVSEALVIGVPDSHWGERVHAVVVPTPGGTPTAEELATWCRDRLARFKWPRSFELRDELPRLPTGKIAKGALRSELAGDKLGRIGS